MLWFLSLAAQRGYCVDGYLDNAFGEMGKNEHGKMVMLSVTLCPVIKWSSKYRPTTEEIAALHEQAHAECFIANSVKTAVRIRPMI